MTQYLPPNLLALFAPRDPIPYLPPPTKLPCEKRTDGYAGIASLTDLFEDPKDTPPPKHIETREEKLERKRREKAEKAAYRVEQGIAQYNPKEIKGATSEAYKTIFVGRINYDTTESKLRREFETYGPVKKISMIHDKEGKPRGYAFIEFEHESDMKHAYKYADGKKIDGRRVIVDCERGRTVSDWLPRRLGGGLGGTRRGGQDDNVRVSGREDNYDRHRDEARDVRSRDRDRSSKDRDRDRGDRGDRDRDRDRRERDPDRADRGDRSSRSDRRRERDRSRERSDRTSHREERGSRGGGDSEKHSYPAKRPRSRSPIRSARSNGAIAQY